MAVIRQSRQLAGQRRQFALGPVLEPVLLVVAGVRREDGAVDPEEVAAKAETHDRQEQRRELEQHRLGETRRRHGPQLNSSVKRTRTGPSSS